IYRGDSFQLRLVPDSALIAAIHIKSTIRQLANLDVRMAIGIGTIDTEAKKVTEVTGEAFIRSGSRFDEIGKQMLVIDTGQPELNETLNLMISLALLTLNSWSETVATAIKTSIENPHKNQSELAEILQKTQSSISEALKRGGYDEVKKLNKYYQSKIGQL
ncbi:MAG TPA: hypothetical protein VL943_01995, partial [Niabella sp.]|nr:hypothetical protein [Niabella sp.]